VKDSLKVTEENGRITVEWDKRDLRYAVFSRMSESEFSEFVNAAISNYLDDQERKLTAHRAQWEEKHHKTFNYKQTVSHCQECGETDGRHTYRCIYFDTEK
jgi:hypothetical protein